MERCFDPQGLSRSGSGLGRVFSTTASSSGLVTTLHALLILVIVPFAHADMQSGISAYRAGRYEAALRDFEGLAEAGVVQAQSILGVMYEYGEGVPQSYLAAAGWYRLAARGGSAAAQFNLAELYAQGLGVRPSRSAARIWYELAAKQGHERARRRLAEVGSPAATYSRPFLALTLDGVLDPNDAPAPVPANPSVTQFPPLRLDYELSNTP